MNHKYGMLEDTLRASGTFYILYFSAFQVRSLKPEDGKKGLGKVSF